MNDETEDAEETPASPSEAGESADETNVAGPAGLPHEALQAEIDRLKDQLLRALADGENLRRRSEREREEAAKYAGSQLARDLLSVSDNLRRALESIKPETVVDDGVKNLLAGIEATERELHAVFERRHITRIDPIGVAFDPNFHQAMMEIEDSANPVGTVVQVLQPGFLMHDRLLRPALVGVSKGGATSHRIDTKA